MKCPYCGSHDVVRIPIGVGKKVNLNNPFQEIKYYCNKCKKGFSGDKVREEREGAG